MIMKWIFRLFSRKCDFCDECEYYRKNSKTCNVTGGMYYGDSDRPAGCYVKMLNKKWNEMNIKR